MKHLIRGFDKHLAQSDGLMFLTPTAQGERLRQRQLFSGNPSPISTLVTHADIRTGDIKEREDFSSRCSHGKCNESSEILKNLSKNHSIS